MSDKTLLESVVKEEVKAKLEEDNEVDRRRNNIIIYRIPKDLKESPEKRKASDLQFVVNMCDGVFNIKLQAEDVLQMYRLGRPSEGGNIRPLLISFRSEGTKSEIMSNTKNLRESNQ